MGKRDVAIYIPRCPIEEQREPILNLTPPHEIEAQQQIGVIEATRKLNRLHLQATGDEEISTRINAYEMAYRMQTSAPELMDTSKETRETLDLYGIRDPKESTFARNCLLADDSQNVEFDLYNSITRTGTITGALPKT